MVCNEMIPHISNSTVENVFSEMRLLCFFTVYTDGTRKNLISVTGTIPVMIKGYKFTTLFKQNKFFLVLKFV